MAMMSAILRSERIRKGHGEAATEVDGLLSAIEGRLPLAQTRQDRPQVVQRAAQRRAEAAGRSSAILRYMSTDRRAPSSASS